jgi:hypothetical protein
MESPFGPNAVEPFRKAAFFGESRCQSSDLAIQ